MTSSLRLTLIFAACFLAAIGGVFLGRSMFPGAPPPGAEIHDVLHNKLALDESQRGQLAVLEQRFRIERQALELELRADNARLAVALQAEHGNGPRVGAAVDRSHAVLGQIQKATLSHIFAMRQLLKPNQAAMFDAAVVRALTDAGAH